LNQLEALKVNLFVKVTAKISQMVSRPTEFKNETFFFFFLYIKIRKIYIYFVKRYSHVFYNKKKKTHTYDINSDFVYFILPKSVENSINEKIFSNNALNTLKLLNKKWWAKCFFWANTNSKLPYDAQAHAPISYSLTKIIEFINFPDKGNT
jgi:hypothetical protein